MPIWAVPGISFEIVNDMTDDPVVTLLITTPAGLLTVTAEPVTQGTILVLRGTHMQDATPNAVGAGNLMVIARALMERMGFDGLVVEGALRTTGANPGRRPRVLRFSRRFRPANTGRAGSGRAGDPQDD
jgi:hypothetical protein